VDGEDPTRCGWATTRFEEAAVAVIEVEGLHKTYGDRVAVDDVGLEVRAGEIFGLLGPNGAGKTTTVEILQGLRRRDRGRVRVLGMDPQRDGDRLRRRIGAQLQSSALPDRLRVGEALWLFARGRDGAPSLEWLGRRWGLEGLWRRPFAKLSGGEQQRLFIALALVNRPEVVFFDELTTGLDPQARRATWDLVRRVRDDGATVVLVTHFMEEAEELCDRVAIVDRGRVVATGTPSELVRRADATQRVSFTWPDANAAWLSHLAGVARVTRRGDAVEVVGDGALAVRVAAGLASRGVAPDDFRTHHPDLEDVFLALTGRDLRA
jgi:ABC-2 type transport system ATP-binding protein